MAYSGYRRPPEYASKSSHSSIIKDQAVIDFIGKCTFQTRDPEDAFDNILILNQKGGGHNPIKRVMAADGGITEVAIQESFPSTTISFLRYGVSYFEMEDLMELDKLEFIGYEDIVKLDNFNSFSFVLPTKNIRLKDCENIKDSFRQVLYEHFLNADVDDYNLMDTLVWFMFRDYSPDNKRNFVSIQCPHCERNADLFKSAMKKYAFKCPHCGQTIYLTDVLKIHNAVSDDNASAIKKPLSLLLEQLLLVHYIRISLEINPNILNETLFIRDGPLAFFGDLSNLSVFMHDLFKYLLENNNLFLVGIEKSGAFVDFAHIIDPYLENGSVMLLNSDYIYKHIYYGSSDKKGYGYNTYYGCKVIFKSFKGDSYVLTVPTTARNMNDPKEEHYKNLSIILDSLTMLKSDKYDNALLPIALVNKNVSISDVPGSVILQKLAKTIE